MDTKNAVILGRREYQIKLMYSLNSLETHYYSIILDLYRFADL